MHFPRAPELGKRVPYYLHSISIILKEAKNDLKFECHLDLIVVSTVNNARSSWTELVVAISLEKVIAMYIIHNCSMYIGLLPYYLYGSLSVNKKRSFYTNTTTYAFQESSHALPFATYVILHRMLSLLIFLFPSGGLTNVWQIIAIFILARTHRLFVCQETQSLTLLLIKCWL